MRDSIGLRQLSILTMSAVMIAIGYLGLSGSLSAGPVVMAVLLAIVVVGAYSVGKRRAEDLIENRGKPERA